MSQEPPPLPRGATPPPPVAPPAPLLEYGARREPGLGVGQYLVHFTSAAIVVGVLLFALTWVGRMKQVFKDFGLKLPRSTQLLLDVSDASRACYGWVLLALVPFVAPFLLTRVRPETRRWVGMFAFLCTAAVIVFTIVAMFEPMVTLIEGISGSGKK